MNSPIKTCQSCKTSFIITPDDLVFYKKIDVSPPTLCPQCRYQRRIANRNEWNFYKRECDLCSKDMVTIYNKNYPGPVYCQPCWWSDKWDTLDYGKNFDFSRPFFKQFKELRFKVPRIALTNNRSTNSEYTNQAQSNKNCFMCVATSFCEDCLYGQWAQGSKECVDCYSVEKCEVVYESIYCSKCYKSAYLENCISCSNSYFLYDCRGCNDCFGCIGLRNKSYCWFNEQLSKEEYEKRLKDFPLTFDEIQRTTNQFRNHILKFPHKYYQGSNNVNSTGNYLENNKSAINVFHSNRSEHSRYSQDAWEARNCMDLTETLDNELDYELEGIGWASNNIALCKGWYNSNALYTELAFHSHNVFGCVGLMKKNYCIFNKQYTKDEYEKLKAKIITHMKKTKEWGEFFPIEISPFTYNETVAQEYFPLTKEEVESRNWRWYDRENRDYRITMHVNDIPNNTKNVNDSIINEIIECANKSKNSSCTTAFRIVPAEREFYKKMGLPPPHKCPPCRRQNRLNKRNPRKLWHRKCMKEGCPNEFETSYTPERKEIVYCETCYNSEVA